MTRRATAMMIVAVLGAVGCGPWQRVGSDQGPARGTALPRLFDATAVYRSMGFLVAGPPLPFVASLRYLADATADSTLTLFALSLANNALTFTRDGNEFVAEYHVEVAFRSDTAPPRQIARDETVRVRSFRETLRADESVIYQQFLALRPGPYVVSVLVRDRHGPALARHERPDTVPRLVGATLAAPIAFYEGTGRSRLNELPRLLANPRATLPYGADSLRFYVEGYGLPREARLAARAVDGSGTALWGDTVPLRGEGGFAKTVLVLAPGQIPVGQGELEVGLVGSDVSARAPFLVSFSSQWVITNFDEMISMLRYFERPELVARLRDAPPDEQPALWREFWRATDPVPITPENEALDGYFRRIQQANLRFQGEGDPGWLTDRGEVFITLGEPDEILDMSSGFDRSGVRSIRWTYINLRLTVFFQDQTGFGRFRLTPLSRAEYQRVLARVRRAQ